MRSTNLLTYLLTYLHILHYRRVSEAVDWHDPVLHSEESVVPGIHLSNRQWSDVTGHQSGLSVPRGGRILRWKRGGL